LSEACEATLLRTLDAICSSSVALKVTEFCFLLHQETMANFMIEQQPDVLFWSTILSAQSESTYPATQVHTGGISRIQKSGITCIQQQGFLNKSTKSGSRHQHCNNMGFGSTILFAEI
jgi:hypothetical protein